MATQVIMPKLTYEMLEGLILEWLCEEGSSFSVGQSLYLVETDKATIEVPADEAGTLLKILVPAGETVSVGAPVAWVGAAGEKIPETETGVVQKSKPEDVTVTELPVDIAAGINQATDQERSTQEKQKRLRATPVARRLAQELGIELEDVGEYSGYKMIRESDVRDFDKNQNVHKEIKVETQRDTEHYDLSFPTPLEKTMASHMLKSASIPQMASTREVNLSRLDKFREERQSAWEHSLGYRLTYTHLFATLAVRALTSHPKLNASWTEQGIYLYHGINLGVAMSSKRGLVVPVVQNAHKLSLEQMANQIVQLQLAVESNRLSPRDLSGGTFTMTNVGMLGVELSIPLLNPPQSAILGIGAKRVSLQLDGENVISKPVASVTVTVDHRFVDGAAAAEFLASLKKLIESPGDHLG